jgi:hypothetical protein
VNEFARSAPASLLGASHQEVEVRNRNRAGDYRLLMLADPHALFLNKATGTRGGSNATSYDEDRSADCAACETVPQRAGERELRRYEGLSAAAKPSVSIAR